LSGHEEFDIPDDADSGVLKDEQIELLFKQLKQNFPLKYFLGDNENAIIIQIWSVMLANLLLMILKSQIKRKWAFSNMVSVIRQHLMSYIDAGRFFENPEKAWQELIEEQKSRQKGMTDQYSLFAQWEGACF
jgi:hypothetical protein